MWATGSSSDRLFLGDASGCLSICNATATVLTRVQLFQESITHIKEAYSEELGNITFAVGQWSGGDLSGGRISSSGAPLLDPAGDLKVLLGPEVDNCLLTITLSDYSDSSSPVTALAVSSDGSLVCIGHEDGEVLLVALSLNAPGAGFSEYVVHRLVTGSGDAPRSITGLYFVDSGRKLFVVFDTSLSEMLASRDDRRTRVNTETTGGGIFVYTVARASELLKMQKNPLGADELFTHIVLDAQGTTAGRCDICRQTEQLVVTRYKSISVYSTSRKDGERECPDGFVPSGLHCIGPSEVLVYSGASRDGTQGSYAVYDLHEKARYYHGDLAAGDRVRMVASNSRGVAFLLCAGGELIRLSRKDVQQRVDEFSRRGLFQSALELAAREGMGSAVTSAIAREYGDYLLSQGDEEGALSSYASAMADSARPSVTVRRLLDTCGVEVLEKYLLELQRTRTHTSHVYMDCLLVSVYAKNGKAREIEAFLHSLPERTTSMAELATRALLESGFSESAEALACTFDCHGLYLSICMRRLAIEPPAGPTTDTVLAYLRSLHSTGPDRVLHDAVLTHGVALLESNTLGFTKLLVDLCSPERAGKSSSARPLPVGKYMEVFSDHQDACFTLLLVVFLSFERLTAGGKNDQKANFMTESSFPMQLLQDMLSDMCRRVAPSGADDVATTGTTDGTDASALTKEPIEYLDYLSEWWGKDGSDPRTMRLLLRVASSLLLSRGVDMGDSAVISSSAAASSSSSSYPNVRSIVERNFISDMADVDLSSVCKRIQIIENIQLQREREFHKSYTWLKSRQMAAAVGEGLSEQEVHHWKSIRQAQEKRSMDDETFRRELAVASDTDLFSPLGNYFGKIVVLNPEE